MGLRCSLLGHDFGETEVEREREEQGSEVIETVREAEVCSRCGETKLVSENTNVTTLDAQGSATETGATDADDPAAEESRSDPSPANAAASTSDGPATGDPAGDGEDAEIIDETAAEPDAAEDARTETADEAVTEAEGSVPDAEEPAPGDAAEADDAVILDDEADEPATDREYGQWPDADDTGDPEGGDAPTAWPDQEGEDQGYDAELSDEEADVEFGGGLTPEADPDAAPADGEETVGGRGSEETGFTSATTAPSPDAPADTTEVDTEFFCPECEQVTPAARSSLRAGDICPECKHGYITERER